MVEPSRVRRSPTTRYRPRTVRKLSYVDIDAFNQGLHNKRPKFIGKRRVQSSMPPCILDSFGNCVADVDVDAGSRLTADKRRRKFMGKKSDVDAANSVMEKRVRKFLGKRGPRKFVGRRAYTCLLYTSPSPRD